MADNPGTTGGEPLSSEEVIRRIVLELKAQVHGRREAQQFFDSTRRSLHQASRAVGDYAQSTLRSTAMMDKMWESLSVIRKSLKTFVISFAPLTGAVSGLITIVKSVVKDMSDLGNQFNQIAITIGVGQRAVNNLIDTYRDLHANSILVITDIRDIADAVNRYATSGFLQWANAAEKSVMEGFAKMQNVLGRFGQKQLYDQVLADIGKRAGDLAARNFATAFASVDPNDFKGMARIIEQNLATMGEAGFQLREALLRAADAEKKILDPLSQINYEWTTAVGAMTQEWQRFKNELWMVLGPTAVELVRKLTDVIASTKAEIGGAGDTLAKVAHVIHNNFVFITKAVVVLGSAVVEVFGTISQVMGLAIEGAGELVKVLSYAIPDFLGGKSVEGLGEILDEAGEYTRELGVQASKAARQLSALSPQLKRKSYDDMRRIVDDIITGRQKEVDAGKTAAKSYADSLKAAKELAEIAKNISGYMKLSSEYAGTLGKQLVLAGRVPFLEQEQVNIARDIGKEFEGWLKTGPSAMKTLQQMIKQERQVAATAQTEKERSDALNRLTQLQSQLNSLSLQGLEYSNAMIDSVRDRLRGYERELELTGKAEQLTAQRKEMLTAIMGAPGMGIEAIRQENEALQRSLDTLRAMQQQNIAGFQQQIKMLEELEQRTTDIAELQEIALRKQQVMNQFKANQADIESDILEKTIKQLQNVKDLRQGYLDAIGAMALGAGKFEKFLITQERNVGKGLRMGAVRPTPLLGEAGVEAAKAQRPVPMRWTTQFGVMQTMEGMDLTAADYEKFTMNIAERVDNTTKAIITTSTQQMQQMRESSSRTNDILYELLSLAKSRPAGIPPWEKAVKNAARQASHFRPRFPGLDPATGAFTGGYGPPRAIFTAPPVPHYEGVLPLTGYQTGGFTGFGPASAPAGIVHHGEIVFEKPIVDKYKQQILQLREEMRGGLPENRTYAYALPFLGLAGLWMSRKIYSGVRRTARGIGRAKDLVTGKPIRPKWQPSEKGWIDRIASVRDGIKTFAKGEAPEGVERISANQYVTAKIAKPLERLSKPVQKLTESNVQLVDSLKWVGKGIRGLGATLAAIDLGYTIKDAYAGKDTAGTTLYKGLEAALWGTSAAVPNPVTAALAFGFTGSRKLEQWISGEDTDALDALTNAREALRATIPQSQEMAKNYQQMADYYAKIGDTYRATLNRSKQLLQEANTLQTEYDLRKDTFRGMFDIHGEIWQLGQRAENRRREGYEEWKKIREILNLNEFEKAQPYNLSAAYETAVKAFDIGHYMMPVVQEMTKTFHMQYLAEPDRLEALRAYRHSLNLEKLQIRPDKGIHFGGDESVPRLNKIYETMQMVEEAIRSEKTRRGITTAEEALPTSVPSILTGELPSLFKPMQETQQQAVQTYTSTAKEFNNSMTTLRALLSTINAKQIASLEEVVPTRSLTAEVAKQNQDIINKFLAQLSESTNQQEMQYQGQQIVSMMRSNLERIPQISSEQTKEIVNLIDRVEQLFDNIKPIPVVEPARYDMQDILSQIKEQIPQDFGQAQEVLLNLFKTLTYKRTIEEEQVKELKKIVYNFDNLSSLRQKEQELIQKIEDGVADTGTQQQLAEIQKSIDSIANLDPETIRIHRQNLSVAERNADYASKQLEAIINFSKSIGPQNAQQLQQLMSNIGPFFQSSSRDTDVYKAYMKEQQLQSPQGADPEFVATMTRGFANLKDSYDVAKARVEDTNIYLRDLQARVYKAQQEGQKPKPEDLEQIKILKEQLPTLEFQANVLKQQLEDRATVGSKEQFIETQSVIEKKAKQSGAKVAETQAALKQAKIDLVKTIATNPRAVVKEYKRIKKLQEELKSREADYAELQTRIANRRRMQEAVDQVQKAEKKKEDIMAADLARREKFAKAYTARGQKVTAAELQRAPVTEQEIAEARKSGDKTQLNKLMAIRQYQRIYKTKLATEADELKALETVIRNGETTQQTAVTLGRPALDRSAQTIQQSMRRTKQSSIVQETSGGMRTTQQSPQVRDFLQAAVPAAVEGIYAQQTALDSQQQLTPPASQTSTPTQNTWAGKIGAAPVVNIPNIGTLAALLGAASDNLDKARNILESDAKRSRYKTGRDSVNPISSLQ